MKVQFYRPVTFGGSRERGFGLTAHWGCLGTTYGEIGLNMFYTVRVWVWKGYEFSWTWKRLEQVKP